MSSYSSGHFPKLWSSNKADNPKETLDTTSCSLLLSIATLLKNMMGAGIVSLPVGLKYATPLPGLAILLFIGMLSACSYWMIGYCCIVWQVKTFRDLWNKVLGSRSAWIIDTTIFCNGWFTLVVYVVLIGDFTTKSLEGLFYADHFLARNRALSQWIVTFTVLLPLSLAKDLSRLAFTSILGLAVMLYVVALAVKDFWLHAPEQWSPDFEIAKWQIGSFEAIALYTHAFVAHYNAPKIFAELHQPTHARWVTLVATAYVLAFTMYAGFAWAGIRRFEGEVLGNILRNYSPDFSVLIAWLGMGFSIAFTYPLVFNSTREAALNLAVLVKQHVQSNDTLQSFFASPKAPDPRACKRSQPAVRRTSTLVSLLGPSPESQEKKIHRKPGRRSTVVLVMLASLVGTLCKDAGVVNALAGAVMGCMVCLVLPALIFFNSARLQLQAQGNGEKTSLKEPLLPSRATARAEAKKPHAAAKGCLWFSMALGAFTCCAGIVFIFIGTAVILTPKM